MASGEREGPPGATEKAERAGSAERRIGCGVRSVSCPTGMAEGEGFEPSVP